MLVGKDRRFRGGVRHFLHHSRSPAVAEGLNSARKRWHIRKEKRRRRKPRDRRDQHRRDHDRRDR